MTKYVLEYHPTVKGIPVAIFERPPDGASMKDARVVAILNGDAAATMEEAKAMVAALNAMSPKSDVTNN